MVSVAPSKLVSSLFRAVWLPRPLPASATLIIEFRIILTFLGWAVVSLDFVEGPRAVVIVISIDIGSEFVSVVTIPKIDFLVEIWLLRLVFRAEPVVQVLLCVSREGLAPSRPLPAIKWLSESLRVLGVFGLFQGHSYPIFVNRVSS